jgi:hypothetical protein
MIRQMLNWNTDVVIAYNYPLSATCIALGAKLAGYAKDNLHP